MTKFGTVSKQGNLVETWCEEPGVPYLYGCKSQTFVIECDVGGLTEVQVTNLPAATHLDGQGGSFSWYTAQLCDQVCLFELDWE